MLGQRRRRLANIKTALSVELPPSKHDTLTNVGLMLGRRRRRMANINPTLGQSHVIAEQQAMTIYQLNAELRLGHR